MRLPHFNMHSCQHTRGGLYHSLHLEDLTTSHHLHCQHSSPSHSHHSHRSPWASPCPPTISFQSNSPEDLCKISTGSGTGLPTTSQTLCPRTQLPAHTAPATQPPCCASNTTGTPLYQGVHACCFLPWNVLPLDGCTAYFPGLSSMFPLTRAFFECPV